MVRKPFRLNRTIQSWSGTFVLDFFNEPEDILDAFLPYHKTATSRVSDPDLIYDLCEKLRPLHLPWTEVERSGCLLPEEQEPCGARKYLQASRRALEAALHRGSETLQAG